MPTAPSYVGVAGMCAECMRDNVDADRNFCEKNIRDGACDLVVPEPFYTIATEHKQENNIMAEQTIDIHEKKDSITLKRNAKGEYAWDLKTYWDGDKEDHVEILEHIRVLDDELREMFG